MADRCKHENFHAVVAVNRMMKNEGDSEPAGYLCEITVRCVTCDTPFEFIGLPCGAMFDQPCVDPSAQELRAPIRPKGLALLPGLPGCYRCQVLDGLLQNVICIDMPLLLEPQGQFSCSGRFVLTQEDIDRGVVILEVK